MGGDSCQIGCELGSQCCILNVSFSHLFVCKICIDVRKTKINKETTVDFSYKIR